MKIYSNTGDVRSSLSGGSYQADVSANGSAVLANAKLNFVDSSSILVVAAANGTTQANVSLVANVPNIVGPAYAQANAAYAQANSAYAQANAANVNAQTAISLAIAANTEAQSAFTLANSDVVYANGASRVNVANLNFINTATVNVSVTANGTTQANIAFSVNTSAVGGGGGNGNVANATTTVRGITLLIDTTNSTDNANAATANAVGTVFTTANSANATAQAAIVLAANAFTLANSDAVYANGGSVVFTPNLNFVNTATVTVSVTANGNQANISFTSSGGGGGGSGNGNVNIANLQIAFGTATNTVGGSANATYNTTSNLMSVEANLRLSNASSLIFGGQQSNTVANSHFAMSYNATANSIDITFLG